MDLKTPRKDCTLTMSSDGTESHALSAATFRVSLTCVATAVRQSWQAPTRTFTPRSLPVADAHRRAPDQKDPHLQALLIGETGFEPATARPPARAIGCRSVERPVFIGFLRLSASQFSSVCSPFRSPDICSYASKDGRCGS